MLLPQLVTLLPQLITLLPQLVTDQSQQVATASGHPSQTASQGVVPVTNLLEAASWGKYRSTICWWNLARIFQLQVSVWRPRPVGRRPWRWSRVVCWNDYDVNRKIWGMGTLSLKKGEKLNDLNYFECYSAPPMSMFPYIDLTRNVFVIYFLTFAMLFCLSVCSTAFILLVCSSLPNSLWQYCSVYYV